MHSHSPEALLFFKNNAPVVFDQHIHRYVVPQIKQLPRREPGFHKAPHFSVVPRCPVYITGAHPVSFAS